MSAAYKAVPVNADKPEGIWYVERNGLNVLKTGGLYGGKFDVQEYCEAEADLLNAALDAERGA